MQSQLIQSHQRRLTRLLRRALAQEHFRLQPEQPESRTQHSHLRRQPRCLVEIPAALAVLTSRASACSSDTAIGVLKSSSIAAHEVLGGLASAPAMQRRGTPRSDVYNRSSAASACARLSGV